MTVFIIIFAFFEENFWIFPENDVSLHPNSAQRRKFTGLVAQLVRATDS
jgi:hypothetical protein